MYKAYRSKKYYLFFISVTWFFVVYLQLENLNNLSQKKNKTKNQKKRRDKQINA